MSSVSDQLPKIRQALTKAAAQCGRNPSSIKLIAVSKTKSSELIREAFQAGQKEMGENYVQELLAKQKELVDLPLAWHFVGNLQRRKVKDIVGRVELIHSLDSLELAEEIGKRSEKKQNCLLQINISRETRKGGFFPEKLRNFLEKVRDMKNLEITGLMTLPPFFENPEESRPFFRKLRELREEVNTQKMYRHDLTELSMGMSHDFPVAIEEGSTLIRIGSAIFGERN